MKIRVCGLDFDDIGTEHAVRAALTGGNACFVVTPNALMLEDCARSPEHLRLLSGASLILPDGGGVVRAAARLGTPFAHGRVAGIDFGEALLSACAARGERVFLLGGADGVAACAAENLRRRFPALTIVGTYWGYFDRDGEENRNLISVIRACRPTVLPVCLGYPAQEEWIARNLPLLPSVRVAAGLGGSLDVWRMLAEPHRLANLPALVRFSRLCRQMSDETDGNLHTEADFHSTILNNCNENDNFTSKPL